MITICFIFASHSGEPECKISKRQIILEYCFSSKPVNYSNICIPMFIAAQFTIAKLSNQPRCPSTNAWITKLWEIIHNGILLSNKEEQNNIIREKMEEP